jgi:hypothetical protein
MIVWVIYDILCVYVKLKWKQKENWRRLWLLNECWIQLGQTLPITKLSLDSLRLGSHMSALPGVVSYILDSTLWRYVSLAAQSTLQEESSQVELGRWGDGADSIHECGLGRLKDIGLKVRKPGLSTYSEVLVEGMMQLRNTWTSLFTSCPLFSF